MAGSIVKILFYLKSNLFSNSSCGIFHSPVYLSKSLVNTLSDSWILKFYSDPSTSYSSEQMSNNFNILKLSASKLPASPILEVILQNGLEYYVFQHLY